MKIFNTSVYLIPIFFLSLVSTSCASRKSVSTSGSKGESLRSHLVEDARSALGSKYQYGDTGKKGYDCSGLVYSVFTQNNVSIPRSTEELVKFGKSVKKSELQPGDLVFFKNVKKTDHVAIVSRLSHGSTWLIHSTTSQGVVETNLEKSIYWAPRVVQYRSLLK